MINVKCNNRILKHTNKIIIKKGDIKMISPESKVYPDCMLYKKFPAYNKSMIDCIAKSSRIDKSSKEFEDVIYEIKRMKTTNSIMKVLVSKNTVLVVPPFPMPKTFKVFVAKDF